MTAFRLTQCRGAARALLTGFLVTTGIGFIVALLQVHATMGGMNPDAIADAIRGDGSAAAEFAEEFGEAGPGAAGGLQFGKGYGEMVETAHTHTFAIPLLFLALGGIFLGSDLSEGVKTAVLSATFLTIVLDLASLWLVRYVSPHFTYLSIVTGTALSAAAAVLILRSLWDLWRRPAA